ncbi:MAG TPA: response regulator [Bacteroidota bacterium]|nr:response regulator [Bacteroidota bacterium]
MTLLFVDDEVEYRLLMRNILIAEGMEVLLAANGEEALEKLKVSKVDMIISDLYMPVMDGFKLYRAVRSTPGLEKLPFLFVSAFDDPHTKEAVKDPRYDGFIRKASPVPDLLEWIKYLTTPEQVRPHIVPGGNRFATQTRARDGMRTSTRTFTL